jgi:phosphoribosylamine---glycine ligase
MNPSNQMQPFPIPLAPKVLIVGNGAREHAIAWKLAQSPHRPTLYVAPGNAGMVDVYKVVNIAVDDVQGLVQFAQSEGIDLLVVGPEVPLSKGIVNLCEGTGIRVFGPTREAAVLESSKAEAKAWMKRANVPTADYATFDDADLAKAYIMQQGAPIVVKADGLAAGKGVVVANSVEEACAAVDEMMVGRRFGPAGQRIVIESFLRGDEVSMMFFVDAHVAVPMVSARDYKRLLDGNNGPNTGGMGAFAPVSEFSGEGFVASIQTTIVEPMIQALRSDGIPYRGVLYAGLMMTETGPQVVEFNCRFGDPETEVVLPLLQSDLLEVMWAVTCDRLEDVPVIWSDERAVCVVLAAPGYPVDVQSGGEIRFDDNLTDADILFHAGTSSMGGRVVTSGGRVMTVVGRGHDFTTARRIAYSVADAIYFEGKHMRRDIAGFE